MPSKLAPKMTITGIGNVSIDISFLFSQLCPEHFWKITREPPFYYLCESNCFNCKESKFHNIKINHSANDSSCINHNIKKLINITDFGTITKKVSSHKFLQLTTDICLASTKVASTLQILQLAVDKSAGFTVTYFYVNHTDENEKQYFPQNNNDNHQRLI